MLKSTKGYRQLKMLCLSCTGFELYEKKIFPKTVFYNKIVYRLSYLTIAYTADGYDAYHAILARENTSYSCIP